MVPMLEMEAAEAAPPPNLLRQLHTLLRGRYWLAALLVLVGTVAGAWIGHGMKEPLYRSTGLVRVRPYIPRILYESEQSGVMPMFDAFVGSQVELMKSERVANLAMQDAEWAALGRGLAPAQVVSFRGSLNVARPKGSEMIVVTFDDGDPEAARLAVKAVITAYQRLHAEAGGEAVAETIRILEDRSAMLTADLKALNDSIFAINNEQATGTLEKIYDHKLSELQTLESELRRVELEVAIARGATGAMDAGEPIPIDSPESLALHVPAIRNLMLYLLMI
jgi:uncharacterized protein involved in exopolysaccharide biosynthesis